MEDNKKVRRGIVSYNVIADPEISVEAKAIYTLLCCYADKTGTCFPSIARICKELNINERRLRRHMQPLIDRGIITKDRKREGNLKQGNIYKIADDLRQFDNTFLEGSKLQVSSPDQSVLEGSSPDHTISRPDTPRSVQNDNTNSYNINSPLNDELIKTLTNYVCMVLNQHRKNIHSKGRLKPGDSGKMVIKELLKKGFTADQIREHAMNQPEYEKGRKDKYSGQFDWLSFLYSFPGIKGPGTEIFRYYGH